MATGRFRFERFILDPGDRRLMRDEVPVELNARYLDALALLVSERGQLVSKDRFFEEVWRGVPVTDEALTQCIRTLRRQLGDEAARPRFIETVPKHGYRFIAAVEPLDDEIVQPSPAAEARSPDRWRALLLLGGAGTIGGGFAGLVGGLVYGFAGASQPLEPGMGAASVVVVLVALSVLIASVGGAGVGFGIAASGSAAGRLSPWSIAGGAAGGLIVGAAVKLFGLDAFNLLVGRSPGDITGAAEGALLGAAVGFGAWLAARGDGRLSLRRAVAAAGLSGGAAGLLVTALGGRLMAGSLDLLARSFPGSRLRLDPLGAVFGEQGFGPVSRIVTGAAEGALFGACVVGAMLIARRRLSGG